MADETADEILAGTESFEGRCGEEGPEVVVLDFFVAHGDEVPPSAIVEDLPQQSRNTGQAVGSVVEPGTEQVDDDGTGAQLLRGLVSGRFCRNHRAAPAVSRSSHSLA